MANLVNERVGVMQTACYEALGTMILVAGICLTVASGGASLLPIPLSLFVAIQIGGDVTGGHFNPGVTAAVMIANGKHGDVGKALVAYWLA